VQALSSAAEDSSPAAPRTDEIATATSEASAQSPAGASEEQPTDAAAAAAVTIQPDKDPATLPGHLGYLQVDSSLDTQVFVQGRLAGKTNALLETFCGRRYVRLGSAPGHWDSDGVTFRIKCQAVNRLTLEPAAEMAP